MDALWASDLAPLIFVAAVVTGGTLLYPLMQGLRNRIEGGQKADVEGLRAEIQALRSEVESLREGRLDADAHDRMLELEERVDFAERLLARGSSEAEKGT